MVVDEFLEQGKPKLLVLKHVGLPRSSYYYTSTGSKPGKRTSRIRYDLENNRHDLDDVLHITKTLLEEEFVDYGYYKT
jgi:predicted DNA-binding ArsR family transcriptional regulator